MEAFEQKVMRVKKWETGFNFGLIARLLADNDRSCLLLILGDGPVNKDLRRLLLWQLLEVPSFNQISQKHGMHFKVWEIAVSIIDKVLSKTQVRKDCFTLLTLTALLIAFKVSLI